MRGGGIWRRLLRSKHLLPILVFILVNLRVLTWLQSGHVMFSGDFRPFLTPSAFKSVTSDAWAPIDFGTPSLYFVEKYSLFNLLSMTAYTLTGDITVSQILAAYILYVVYALTGYFLYYIITGNRLIAFIAAFFITTNPLLVNDREISAVGFITYYYLPTFIVLLVYTYSLEKNSWFYTVSSGLLTFLAASSLPNPRTTVYIASLVVYITLFYMFKRKHLDVRLGRAGGKYSITLIIDRNGVVEGFKALLFFTLGFLIVYAPMIYLYMSEMGPISKAMHEALSLSLTYVRNIKPIEFLRFIYKWAFFSGALDLPYVPYREMYISNTLFELLTYSIPVITITSFIASLIYRRYRLYSVTFFILYSLGILTPAGLVYSDALFMFFARNIILRALLEPVHLGFYSMISAGIVIGIGVQILKEKTEGSLKVSNSATVAVAVFILLLLSIASYPLFTGDVTRNWLNPVYKGYYIPVETFEGLGRIISRDYWTLLVPQKYTYVAYNESGKVWASGNPYPKILGFPYVSGLGTEYIRSPSDGFIEFTFSLFNSGNYSPEDIVKFLSLIGVKYVLVENNIVTGSTDNPKSYLDKLLKSSSVTVSSQSPDRVLLELHEANEIIYAARRYLFYNSYEDIIRGVQNIENLSNVAGLVFVDSSNGYIYNVLQNLQYSQSTVGGEITGIQVVSPSHYIVEAYSNGYLILVLQQSYDDNWIVNVNGASLDQRLHFKANGYGNGWLIPVKGYLRIEIAYRPNIAGLSFTIASITTVFILTSYFLMKNTAYRRRHHAA